MHGHKLPFIFAVLLLVSTAYVAAQPNDNANTTTAVFGKTIPPSIKPTKPPPIVLPAVSQTADKEFYYYRPNGSKIQFKHGSNQYVLMPPPGKAVTNTLSQNLLSQHGNDFYQEKGTAFTRELVFTPKSPVNRDDLFKRMKSTAGTGSFISPVLQTDKGFAKTGVAIARDIVIQFADSANEAANLATLRSRFDITAVTPLRFSQGEYQLTLGESVTDAAAVFQLTRNLAQLDFIEWAEPLMLTHPVSMGFVPNDPLYPNQWHLHNTGQSGALPDADIDAPEGWEISKGDNTVIAIIDDSIQTTHPDLPIWNNPGESGNGKESNGIDDDGNSYIDDYQGWDFYDHDNNPNPASVSDNHGTAVAGVAGAKGNNGNGVTGSAVNARILPIRWGYNCTDIADSIRYAGKYADVVNNSWSIDGCESTLDSAIADAVSGNISAARRGNKGTPVLFAAGNNASGWAKFTLSNLSAGEHTFEWVFLNDAYLTQGDNSVWLDDIVWPDGETIDFDSEIVGNVPTGFITSGTAGWAIVADGVHIRGTDGKSVKSGNISHNQSTQLRITRQVQAGELSYWAWVSSEMNYDWFQFYVDGQLVHQYTPGQYGHNNALAYPASNPDTIAVGASTDGAISGMEERSDYSTFGVELDVVAPSSNQNQRITTTDRLGADGYSATEYTNSFGGTSAATPLVAGIVVNIIAFDPTLTAANIRERLRNTAEKIGTYAYVNNRNDYYGYGRVNLLHALQSLDYDGDLIPDSLDEDDDNDGMPDSWELQYGLNPRDASDALLDSDGDGFTNLQEFQQGTKPNDSSDYPFNPSNNPAISILPIIMQLLME
ncbi:MAG: S8 family serine peptidase [Candidatus Thiothrix sulfatifontis]|nr:MAG: S8 family serine peptidase [Candidatus Thiothrix sulfatifontis]